MEVKFSNSFPIESYTLNDTFLPEHETSPIFINGLLATACPDSCLYSFSFVSTLFVASTASLKLLIGNKIQYNFLGKVFLNNSKICGSP